MPNADTALNHDWFRQATMLIPIPQQPIKEKPVARDTSPQSVTSMKNGEKVTADRPIIPMPTRKRPMLVPTETSSWTFHTSTKDAPIVPHVPVRAPSPGKMGYWLRFGLIAPARRKAAMGVTTLTTMKAADIQTTRTVCLGRAVDWVKPSFNRPYPLGSADRSPAPCPRAYREEARYSPRRRARSRIHSSTLCLRTGRPYLDPGHLEIERG